MKKRYPQHITLKELREANYWSVKWWKNKRNILKNMELWEDQKE